MDTVIGVREFSRNVSRVVSEMLKEKQKVLITHHGKPVAILTPVSPDLLVRLGQLLDEEAQV